MLRFEIVIRQQSFYDNIGAMSKGGDVFWVALMYNAIDGG
jgi:hypothetical protein